MLADQLDYVVGVDPHRDSHALAVVHVISGAIVLEATVAANSEGYAHALELVDEHAAGRRAFAVEGTGSFGQATENEARQRVREHSQAVEKSAMARGLLEVRWAARAGRERLEARK